MRVQKMRKEAAENERDEHFNTIWPVTLTKQEWRVKEMVVVPAPATSDDDMDLLDDDEAPLIKDGSPPPTGVDINMVFMLPVEFRGVEEEVAQMCLNPKEAVPKKLEESSQHLKPLYIRGHIDDKRTSRMLIDGGAAVNLMPYATMNDMCEAIEDFDEVEKLGQGFSSADPLDEIDIGGGITPRSTYVNRNMSLEHKDVVIKLLRDYVDCFT
jgi:hypothetical protein